MRAAAPPPPPQTLDSDIEMELNQLRVCISASKADTTDCVALVGVICCVACWSPASDCVVKSLIQAENTILKKEMTSLAESSIMGGGSGGNAVSREQFMDMEAKASYLEEELQRQVYIAAPARLTRRWYEGSQGPRPK